MTPNVVPMFLKFMSRRERRQRSRQLLNTSVRVMTKSSTLDAVGINISEGGMGVFTVAHLPVGDRVEIEFRTSDGPTTFVRIPGIVRHRALYLYGIEFDAARPNEGDFEDVKNARQKAGASA